MAGLCFCKFWAITICQNRKRMRNLQMLYHTKEEKINSLNWKSIAMPQGKLRGGLRGEVQSTVRENYGSKAVTSNFKSRVVHPRNPKLVKGSPEDDKVKLQKKNLSGLLLLWPSNFSEPYYTMRKTTRQVYLCAESWSQSISKLLVRC